MRAEGGKEEREVCQSWDAERERQSLFASSSGGGKEWQGSRQGQEEEKRVSLEGRRANKMEQKCGTDS